jgi:transposase
MFAVMNRRGKVMSRIGIETTETKILNFVRSIKGPKALAFEESSMSQFLYVLLKSEVDHLVVCDPTTIVKKGAKTDKIDAVELADLLRVNRLKPVSHTDDNQRIDLKILISGYNDLIQEIVRTKNRYKALFRQSAIQVKGTKIYSTPEMIRLLPSRVQQFVARSLLEQLEVLEKHHEGYHKKFKQNLRRFKEMRLIKGIPGFGTITTNQIVGIVVSPSRFTTKYKFFSYAMLVRHKQISNGLVYGSKKAQGQAQLKTIFSMATWCVLASENAFKRKYQQMLLEGASKGAAWRAVRRALAATVLGVWKSGKKYDDHYLEVKRHKSSGFGGK